MINRKCLRVLAQFVVVGALLVAAPGCNHEQGSDAGHNHDHKEGDGHEEGGGARFDSAKGLTLHAEAEEMIGVETSRVAERSLALQYKLQAEVFSSNQESTLVSARIPMSKVQLITAGMQVQILERGSKLAGEGKLLRIDTALETAVGQVEAIIESRDYRANVGEFVEVRFNARPQTVLTIPRQAMLETATGVFVYKSIEERYVREVIVPGIRNVEFVEVVQGLSVGEEVVSLGALDLWLIELRFTKGGGHSH